VGPAAGPVPGSAQRPSGGAQSGEGLHAAGPTGVGPNGVAQPRSAPPPMRAPGKVATLAITAREAARRARELEEG